MTRRPLLVLVFFTVTRIASVWLAAHPDSYSAGGIVPASDVDLYRGWAEQMSDQGQGAYSDVKIEYPPGTLPFILAPEVVGEQTYLVKFIAVMLLVDTAGFAGVLLLSRRWGSALGPWLWAILVPALGPTAYLRLDLVPAIATIWAVERAADRDWFTSGGALGFGVMAKLYPALFVPAALILSPRRWKLALGVASLVVVPLLPLLPSLKEMSDSVLGYHTGRGIQVESLWGAILFIVARSGGDAAIEFNFGALHWAGSVADTLKPLSTVATLVTVGAASLLAFRHRDRPAQAFAEISFTVLAFALGFGSVFSPQFLLWLFALGACVACVPDTRLRIATLLLFPTALMTQVIFPFLYPALLATETGPLIMLWARNLLVVAIAVGSFVLLLKRYENAGVTAPSTPDLVSG